MESIATKRSKSRAGSVTEGTPEGNEFDNSTLSSTQSNGSEITNCEICKSNNDKVIRCHYCEQLSCTKCLKIKAQAYAMISNGEVMWFCHTCRVKVEKQIIVEKEIEERCSNYFQSISTKLDDLENKINKKCDETQVKKMITQECIQLQNSMNNKCDKSDIKEMITDEVKQVMSDQNSVKKIVVTEVKNVIAEENFKTGLNVTTNEASQEAVKEIKDKETRQPNLVIYKIPEPATNLKAEVKSADLDFIKHVSNEILSVPLDTDTDLVKVTRLGERNKDKIRPVLVQFADTAKKTEILANASKLKDAEKPYGNIGITHDMTKQEREQSKKLQLEAKQLEADSEGKWIFKVRGPPWNPRIIKFQNKENA